MVASRVERITFEKFIENVDPGLDIQLRELAGSIDIMNSGIDKESILLYCQ